MFVAWTVYFCALLVSYVRAEIHITSPTEAAVWPQGTFQDIVWTTSGNDADFTITIWPVGGSAGIILSQDTFPDELKHNSGIGGNLPPGKWYIQFADKATNQAVARTPAFTISAPSSSSAAPTTTSSAAPTPSGKITLTSPTAGDYTQNTNLVMKWTVDGDPGHFTITIWPNAGGAGAVLSQDTDPADLSHTSLLGTNIPAGVWYIALADKATNTRIAQSPPFNIIAVASSSSAPPAGPSTTSAPSPTPTKAAPTSAPAPSPSTTSSPQPPTPTPSPSQSSPSSTPPASPSSSPSHSASSTASPSSQSSISTSSATSSASAGSSSSSSVVPTSDASLSSSSSSTSPAATAEAQNTGATRISNGPNAGAIAGGVVGGIVVLCSLALLAVFLLRRRRRAAERNSILFPPSSYGEGAGVGGHESFKDYPAGAGSAGADAYYAGGSAEHGAPYGPLTPASGGNGSGGTGYVSGEELAMRTVDRPYDPSDPATFPPPLEDIHGSNLPYEQGYAYDARGQYARGGGLPEPM